MNEVILVALKEYIDAQVAFQIASAQRDGGDYTKDCLAAQKAAEMAWANVLKQNVSPDNPLKWSW